MTSLMANEMNDTANQLYEEIRQIKGLTYYFQVSDKILISSGAKGREKRYREAKLIFFA